MKIGAILLCLLILSCGKNEPIAGGAIAPPPIETIPEPEETLSVPETVPEPVPEVPPPSLSDEEIAAGVTTTTASGPTADIIAYLNNPKGMTKVVAGASTWVFPTTSPESIIRRVAARLAEAEEAVRSRITFEGEGAQSYTRTDS